jgi:tetratricopeptide (TPR) repeat protein
LPLDLAGSEGIDELEELSADEVLDLDDSAVVAVEDLVRDPYADAIDAAIAADAAPQDDFPLEVDSRPIRAARPVDEHDPYTEEPPLPVSLPSLAGMGDDPTMSAPPELLGDDPRAMAPPRSETTRPEGGSLEDDLDEADFFIQQSMFDDARDILDGLLARYPNHPLVTAKLRDVAALERGASPDSLQALIDPPPAIDRRAAVADELGDFSAPLEEPTVGDLGDDPLPPMAAIGDSGPEPTAVGDVFALARKNVVEKGVTPEDFETHYDLGIAYKEMGLLDDAIAEFTLVMQDPSREVQCHLMLGLCYAEKSLMTDAISQFKEGLYVEQIQDREQMALYYELGQAYERLRDAREALYYYEKVLKRDATFRDVEKRVQLLRGDGVPESSEFGGPGAGEVEEAFDGLLADGQPPINEARGSK